MDFSISGIVASILFGFMGMYMVKKAKADGHWPPLFIGIALMIYPYFIDNDYMLWGIGIVLTVLGFKL